MQQNISESSQELLAQDAGSLQERPAPQAGLVAVLTIAVCAAVLVTHWPALSAQALSFDDQDYFVKNFLVRNPSWDSAKRFLTEVFEPSTVWGYYQPLTMISLMLDYAIGGQTDSLLPFHITSLSLHIANTALIIVLLYQLFGRAWVAAGVGLLFGVHPLTVEPIPWVGERKTLLAAFLTLWSLLLYVRYSRKSNTKVYYGSIAMYVLALLSKPTSTPLPALMLLMDYWPLKRLRWRSLLEKLPFFVIGGISAVITYISQSRTALMITPERYGPIQVPLVICHNIIFYLYKMIWPANLTSHYPFPKPLGLSSPMVLVGVIGTCILIPLLVVSLRWTRAALTGWLMFFVMVFPTIQVFRFSNVIASDKFIYLPSIGILMILAAFLGWVCGAGDVRQHKPKCVAAAIIVLMLAGAESFATRRYLADWKDTVSLFTHMVKVTPRAMSPLNYLGVAFNRRGDAEHAIECFTEMLKTEPNNFEAHVNMGVALESEGKIDEAMSYYDEALRLLPGSSGVYRNIGMMLAEHGRIDEAIAVFRRGLERKLEHPEVLHSGLGTLLLQQGKIDEAISELQLAVKQGHDSRAFNNLGVALGFKGRTAEAVEYHKKAIRYNPKNAEAHYDIANILLSQDKLEQAISEYGKALSINPKYSKAHGNLGAALLQQGRVNEAIEHFTEATKIDPNNSPARFSLAAVLLSKNQLEEAANEYRQVLKLQPADADAHSALGDILVKQGRPEEAAAEYGEALEINPQHPQAQEGLKNIRPKQ